MVSIVVVVAAAGGWGSFDGSEAGSDDATRVFKVDLPTEITRPAEGTVETRGAPATATVAILFGR